jgi:general secretion pathway protein C
LDWSLAYRRLPALALAILMALASWQAWTLAIAIRPHAAARQPPAAALRLSQLDLRGIIGAHLFGQAVVAAEEQVTEVELKLLGVLAAADPGQGMAIIAEPGQPQHVYAVGLRLPGGATLQGVYLQSVLIDLAGEQKVLRLPRGSSGPNGLLAALGLASGEGDGDPVGAGPSAAEGAREFARQQELSSLNPAAALATLNPNPQVIDGALVGYELAPAQFLHVGLQRGDLLKKINGTDMTDPAAANAAFAAISQTGSTELTVLRAGKMVTIRVDSGKLTELP